MSTGRFHLENYMFFATITSFTSYNSTLIFTRFMWANWSTGRMRRLEFRKSAAEYSADIEFYPILTRAAEYSAEIWLLFFVAKLEVDYHLALTEIPRFRTFQITQFCGLSHNMFCQHGGSSWKKRKKRKTWHCDSVEWSQTMWVAKYNLWMMIIPKAVAKLAVTPPGISWLNLRSLGGSHRQFCYHLEYWFISFKMQQISVSLQYFLL